MDIKFIEKNRWSGSVIAMTCGFIFFMLFIGSMVYIGEGEPFRIVKYSILLLVFVLPILILFIFFTPISLKVEGGDIRVVKIIGSIVIPIEDVCYIRAIDQEVVKLSSRMVGSAGVFGYLGIFVNSELGRFAMYTTEKRNLIKIRTNRRTYVFNCRDTDRFIAICGAEKYMNYK